MSSPLWTSTQSVDADGPWHRRCRTAAEEIRPQPQPQLVRVADFFHGYKCRLRERAPDLGQTVVGISKQGLGGTRPHQTAFRGAAYRSGCHVAHRLFASVALGISASIVRQPTRVL